MPDHPSHPNRLPRLAVNEDWLAIIIALLVILLSAAGILGSNGIHIPF
jgi:hypothetical protein